MLTALAALGVIAGDELWFNAQKPVPLHEAAIELLSVARFRTGDFDLRQPEAREFLQQVASAGGDADWMTAGSAIKVIEAVGDSAWFCSWTKSIFNGFPTL